MKTIISVILMTLVSFALSGKSQAQTVRDDNSGQAYFEHAARVLCGPRARVLVSPTSASVILSGEYLADRNLNEVARNLAIDGLNAFPDSPSFSGKWPKNSLDSRPNKSQFFAALGEQAF
jgi:hypothetical protein